MNSTAERARSIGSRDHRAFGGAVGLTVGAVLGLLVALAPRSTVAAEPVPGTAPATGPAAPAQPPGWPAPAGQPAGYSPQVAEQKQPRADEPEPTRPFAFRAEFGIGGFNPTDVNNYIRDQVPSNVIMTMGFSEMVMLLGIDLSGAYYPVRFLGLRPHFLYLFAPKVLSISGGMDHAYWLHSVAPGFSVDFVLDQGKLARWFVSPGASYQLGWFEGYAARGLGLELLGGVELSFGRKRQLGLLLALGIRRADLGVFSAPDNASGSVVVNSLDFSTVMFHVGFQTRLGGG